MTESRKDGIIASDPTADARARCQRYWRHEAVVADNGGTRVCLTNRSGIQGGRDDRPDRTH